MSEAKILSYVLKKVDEAVLDDIIINKKPNGVTATEIEQEFHIFRSNASAILNQLVNKHLLIKIDSRPVYFLPAKIVHCHLSSEDIKYTYTLNDFFSALIPDKSSKKQRDAFDILIGHNDSLSTHIEKAKAAILYPPNGLHTLIIGESGTGKTLFARSMYTYGLEALGKDKKNFPFIEFNCSDYYHNPQLLMSHLFGHIKGAFTGAVSDQPGLVEKADGGILFLDEIHRLPPEGQELLFYLMDTGNYRKLGESTSMRRAQIRIIGATTENPKDVLLKTFMRRIPLTIQLPPYREKTVEERLSIIEHIFVRESTATLKTYIVSTKIVKALVAFPFPGNIGQLSSEIKVLCARSFLNNTNGEDDLVVSFDNLSVPTQEYYEKNTSEIQAYFPSRYESDMIISPSKNVQYNYKRLYDEKAYLSLMKSIDRYASEGYTRQQMNELLSGEISSYCNNILNHLYNQNLHKEEMYKVINKEIVDFTTDAAQATFNQLNLEISQKNILVLAFHFKFLMERAKSSKSITEKEISTLEQVYGNEVDVAQKFVSRFEESFHVRIAKDEKYLIALILANMHEVSSDDGPGLIIVAHGVSTASSMANVCNRLMDCNFVKAVNAPLEQSVQETYQNVLREIRLINPKKGVILLVDMGSLVSFGEKLTAETGIVVRAIPNITMLMALDFTRIMLYADNDVESIYNSFKASHYISNDAHIDNAIDSKPKAILTMCASGSGTSIAFQSMLENELIQHDILGVRVIAVSLHDIRDNSSQYQAIRSQFHVLTYVGNVDLKLDVPFFHISNLISSANKNYFIDFVRESISHNEISATPEPVQETIQDECNRFLSQNVMCVNPSAAVNYSDQFLDALNIDKINADNNLKLSLLLHLGFMLERNICGKKVIFENEKDYIKQNSSLYQTLKEHIHILSEPFGVTINDSELCYIIQTIVSVKIKHID